MELDALPVALIAPPRGEGQGLDFDEQAAKIDVKDATDVRKVYEACPGKISWARD